MIHGIVVAAAVIVLAVACSPDEDQDVLADDVELRDESDGIQAEPYAGRFVVRDPVAGSPVQYFQMLEGEQEAQQFIRYDSAQPFEITEFGPTGELPVEVRRPTIFVVFSQPMTPLTRLGEPMREHPFMEIEPELDGLFRWQGSRILQFQPDDPMTAQLEYEVRISEDTVALTGQELEEGFAFSFYREPLDLVDAFPGAIDADAPVARDDAPPRDARQITVEFSYPVNLGYVVDYLDVYAERTGDTFSFSARRPENMDDQENRRQRTAVLELDREPPENSAIDVTLNEGARSEPEYRGRNEGVTRSFHTLTPFKYQSHRTYSYSRAGQIQQDATSVVLNFTHTPADQDWNEVLNVNLPVDDLSNYISQYGSVLRFDNLPVDYDSTYTIEILPELEDIHGRPLAEPVETVTIEVPDALSYFYTRNRGSRMLEAQFPPRIIFELQNPDPGVWRVDGTEDPFSAFASETLQPYDTDHIERNRKHFEEVDLGDYVNEDGYGFVGVSWNFGEHLDDGSPDPDRQVDLQLQVTDLGVTTRYAHNMVLAWVHSLETGDPVAEAEVELTNEDRTGERWQAETDENGLAVIELEPGEYAEYLSDHRNWDELELDIRHGSDRVRYRPGNDHNVFRAGVRNTRLPGNAEESRAVPYMFTDRELYRPGEEVSWRLIDQNLQLGDYEPYEGSFEVSAVQLGRRGEEFWSDEGSTSATGGAYGTIDLPDDLEPGDYVIEYDRPGVSGTYRVDFQVAHFERAAFDVDVSAPPETLYRGDTMSFGVSAGFLAGGPVAGGDLQHVWFRSLRSFAPQGQTWEEYAFGPIATGSSQVVDQDRGALDRSGRATISLDAADEGVSGATHEYELEARVQDEARQELAAQATALVHPAQFYLATRLEARGGGWTTFVEAEEETELEVIPVRPDGSVWDGDAEVTVEWIERTRERTQQRGPSGRLLARFETVEEVLGEEVVTIQGGEAQTATFVPETSGSYSVRVTGEDPDGGTAVTEQRFFATGSHWVGRLADNPDEIVMEPDQGSYDVGDTAEIVVQAPVPDGEYLVTIEREGILEYDRVEIDGSVGLIEVPITGEHVPVVYVALSGNTEREEPPESYFEPDLGKPEGVFGIVELAVNPSPYELQVTIDPDREMYRPGSDGTIGVEVTHAGEPVESAEVTLLAVDRGVLDLVGYRVPDPLARFYDSSLFPLAVRGADSRSRLIDPVTYDIENLRGGGGGKEAAEAADMAVDLQERDDFRPLALFEPELQTDSDGYAEARFNWPDTLTTYRITAVAMEADRFGLQEQEVSVENPLTVRDTIPQRLRVRDTASAGVVLTNQTDEPVSVSLELEVDDEMHESTIDEPRTVELEPNETLEERFDLAFEEPGDVQLAFTVRSDVLNERLHAEVPVVDDPSREAFTVAGNIAEESSEDEGLILPETILPGSGELELRFSALEADYLREPFERWLNVNDDRSLEMLVYRAAPYALFGDDLKYILSEKQVDVSRDRAAWLLERLGEFQHNDGGFTSWRHLTDRFDHSRPRSTLLGAEAALWLRDTDEFDYRDASEQISYNDLRHRLRSLTVDEDAAPFERAWALLLLSRIAPGAQVTTPQEEVQELGDALGVGGYATGAVAAKILDNQELAEIFFESVKDMVQVGTRSVDFVETYEARSYFDSTVVRSAAVYEAYSRFEPDSIVPARLLSAMGQAVSRSPWTSSMDILWAARAVASAMDDLDGVDTAMVSARIGEHDLFEGELEALHEAPIGERYSMDDEPLSRLDPGHMYSLAFEADAEASVFYTATLSYALPNEIVPARDEGFSVYRSVETVNGDRVALEELEAGETYRITATVAADRNRFGAFMRVPVPSGMEILDGSFATTSTYDEAGGVTGHEWIRETEYGDEVTYEGEGFVRFRPGAWRFYSLEPEQRIYPGEVTYYFPHLYPGSRTVSFLARAVTPGVYPVPPAHIEVEGEEEVFGRSDGELSVIE